MTSITDGSPRGGKNDVPASDLKTTRKEEPEPLVCAQIEGSSRHMASPPETRLDVHKRVDERGIVLLWR